MKLSSIHQSSAVVLRTCQGKHKALHDTSKIFKKSMFDHKYHKIKLKRSEQSRTDETEPKTLNKQVKKEQKNNQR